MEKLPVTSNLSFAHDVFHSFISLVRQNAALCGNGLIVHCFSPEKLDIANSANSEFSIVNMQLCHIKVNLVAVLIFVRCILLLLRPHYSCEKKKFNFNGLF